MVALCSPTVEMGGCDSRERKAKSEREARKPNVTLRTLSGALIIPLISIKCAHMMARALSSKPRLGLPSGAEGIQTYFRKKIIQALK